MFAILHPSTHAASSISFGNPLINCISMNTKKVSVANAAGTNRGRYESNQPKFLYIKNCGILSTTFGNSNVEIKILNKTFFPGNLNLENPYAVNTAEIIVKITLGTTILKVFIK